MGPDINWLKSKTRNPSSGLLIMTSPYLLLFDVNTAVYFYIIITSNKHANLKINAFHQV